MIQNKFEYLLTNNVVRTNNNGQKQVIESTNRTN